MASITATAAAAASSGTVLLSKSLFKKALQCPRKLVYARSGKFLTRTPSSFEETLKRNGKTVEAYARTVLYPNGRALPAGTSVEETKELLESHETMTLFEAAIEHDNVFFRADILHKPQKGEFQLMEIKYKSWDSRKSTTFTGKRGNIRAEYLPYLRDVAFQKWVLQRAYPDYQITTSLVLPDQAKINTKIPHLGGIIFHDDNNNHKIDQDRIQTVIESGESLVTQVNVDEPVDMILDRLKLDFPGAGDGISFTEAIEMFADPNFSASPPPVGLHCRDCEYRTQKYSPTGFQTCWKEATGHDLATDAHELVIDLFGGGKIVDKLLQQENNVFMHDLELLDLGLDESGKEIKNSKKKIGDDDDVASTISIAERKGYQVSMSCSYEGADVTPRVVLQHEYLQQEIGSKWEYPYHFVDFETTMPALPYTVGKHPFQMVAFQFSHHILDQDGVLSHHSEFLHTNQDECPNQFFLNALASSLLPNNSDGSQTTIPGTVFRWGAHENTVLRKLLLEQSNASSDASSVHLLESLLLGGDSEMVDLMQICSKGYFVEGSGGSSSLKNILQPTMAASQKLRNLYSAPTYNGSNFTDKIWWEPKNKKQNTVPRDPYELIVGAGDGIAFGGDAIEAYDMLQRHGPNDQLRSSLLRYCELDTLAMVMILQALQNFVGRTTND